MEYDRRNYQRRTREKRIGGEGRRRKDDEKEEAVEGVEEGEGYIPSRWRRGERS